MTPQEMEESRKNLLKFYKDQNEILTQQDKFQTLKANIAENQAKELMWTIRKAQMLTPPGPDDGSAGDGKNDEK